MLDTTGSMGPLIEGAKRKIWSIATAIVDANPERRNPHGPRRLSRHRRRIRHQDIQPHHRYPGPLRQPAGAQGARRRRLARERQRGAGGRRHQAVVDARRGNLPHPVPGRRRAAAHGLRAGHQISRRHPHGARPRHHRQRGAGRRRARHRAGVARDRPARRRPLHPDPAGRRPGRDHRDAVGHRDHRAAGPHQRHGDPLRPARATLQRRAEDPRRWRPRRRRSPPRWRAT